MTDDARLDPEDGYPEDMPPSPLMVAQRALIQSALVCRGNIERSPDDPVVVALYGRIRDWIAALGLVDAREPVEAAVLDAPLGTLPPHQQIEATWAAEALAVLAWALRLHDLPRYDVKVNPFELTDALFFLDPEARSILDEPTLRGPEELQACREFSYDLHCRIRGSLREPTRVDLAGQFEPEWPGLLGVDPADVLNDGDLSVDGQPIAAVTRTRLAELEGLVRHRHRASIWLVGESERLTETTVDT